MSLSAAVTPIKQTRMAEGQFIADLAGLFERRGVGTGDTFNDAEFERLLRDSDSFRSQLFALCTAISHMSDHDLSGDELLGLLTRALRLPGDGTLPGDLKMLFLSGVDAWNNRSFQEMDEWPPVKKPASSVAIMPAAQSGAPVRPAGVPTLQEAIETARSRNMDRPLQLESASPYPDVNSLAIQDLNVLLGEIEGRMKRLQPQLVAAGAQAPEATPAELMDPVAREAAFLARHPYLSDRPYRRPPVIDLVATPVVVPTVVAAPELPEPSEPKVELRPAETELRLVPRNLPAIEEEVRAPLIVIPDPLRFKTYLALAVLACIALIGTPIGAVVAYRYMHPLYMYEQAPRQPDPVPAVAPEQADSTAQSVVAAKPAVRARKAQPVKRKPEVAVWPPPPRQP